MKIEYIRKLFENQTKKVAYNPENEGYDYEYIKWLEDYIVEYIRLTNFVKINKLIEEGSIT